MAGHQTERSVGQQIGTEGAGRTIGELSTLTGCPVETVRYYERAGIIAEPPRTASGRRLYGEDHIRHLQFIRRARELGFSLERAKRLLRLSEQARPACGEAQDIAKAHLGEVQQRLAELHRIETALNRMLDDSAGDASAAAIIQPLKDGDQASG
jgi:MerR family transcriptional regulator, mercuric resistance operon regulatory protein